MQFHSAQLVRAGLFALLGMLGLVSLIIQPWTGVVLILVAGTGIAYNLLPWETWLSRPRRHEPPAAGRAWSAVGIIPAQSNEKKTTTCARPSSQPPSPQPTLHSVQLRGVHHNGGCRGACRYRDRLLDPGPARAQRGQAPVPGDDVGRH